MSCYQVFLYDATHISPGQEETCGHQHSSLEEARQCARGFDPNFPFDVVWVSADGVIEFTCRREDEDEDD